MKTTTPPVKNSMKHSSRDCRSVAGLLIPLVFVCFTLLPRAQAVGPDTDGSIAGSNNGEGIGVLVSRTTGVWNTGTGFEALSQLTAGNQNTATGLRALSSDTNGGFNTATGVFSLFSNTSGFFNSATGAYSLANNISGTHNTANGYAALYRNTDADDNTATGFAALYHNTTGDNNTATGYQALLSNADGASNSAFGAGALASNTTGGRNNAFGSVALNRHTAGNFNNAFGGHALFFDQSGQFNNAFGDDALESNVSGNTNTAVGNLALANSTGDGNTALGSTAGLNATTGSGNVYIGAGMSGFAGESIHTYIRNINTTTVSGGGADFVTVDLTTGLVGHDSSSRRYKEDIQPMDNSSEALYRLKPVTYRFKKEIDRSQCLEYGLVAEDVAQVDPNLAIRDGDGQIESVRYMAVNAMLLNEFLKEHRKVEEQQATITELKKDFQATVAELNARLKEQESKIEKVSAQLEVSRSAPQMVSQP